MSRIDILVKKYQDHIQLPWKKGIAAPQRVIFCVYEPVDERALRLKMSSFEIATLQARHSWASFDFTETFQEWMSTQRYAERYFEHPDRLDVLLPKYQDYLTERFNAFVEEKNIDDETVVGLSGLGSLYGFLKVKPLIEKFAPLVPGRLVVLFPGRYDQQNNYRLLDGYDGWNYLAVPITSN